jgi:aryl sulfotransferase
MAMVRRRYRTGLTDSARWEAVVLRDDDIVISTPSKCGTTWMQMICALLVFQDPALPAPLTTISPWVDMRLRPLPELVASIEGQQHRRLLKTHTPLDGLPYRPGVTYVVVGRDLRDVAVSMAHHRANLNGEVIAGANRTMAGWPDLEDRLRGWLDDERPAEVNLSSLTGTACHLLGAWERRSDASVVLTHYADLLADLDGEMQRLADALHIEVPAARWPSLVAAATFERMRAHADDLVPDERMGLLLDNGSFFRAGQTGTWRAHLSADDLARYESRIRALLPDDLIAWVER